MYKKLQLGVSSLIISCIWYNVYYQSKDIPNNSKEMDKFIDIVL